MENKKILFGTFIGLLVFMFLGCANAPATPATGTTAPGMDLDAAIREAAMQMETRIPSGTMVALVSVASSSTAFSTQVLTRLESAIVSSGKLVVVDRSNLDKIREEQGFQFSGEVDDESAKSIGKLLGAGAIVTGSLTDLGDVYSLTLKAINMETGTVAVSYLADLSKTTRIETLLASGGGAVWTSTGGAATLMAQPAASASNTPVTPATSIRDIEQVYRIGDQGPAGGIVFYDKGNNSGGWRYMEVSKNDLGKAPWGDAAIRGAATAIGTGKQNTQIIAISGGMASMLCEAYRGGGFSDWFLPSKDELNLIYINLIRINKIVEWEDTYWSSSYYSNGPFDINEASAQRLSDGTQVNVKRHNSYRICAVRQF